MSGQLRDLRQRIRSVQSTQKITKAMELIAASRIARLQQRVAASRPYSDEITTVLTELAKGHTVDHPMLTERDNPRSAAILLVTSDRGFAGGYNSNVIRAADQLQATLREQGKDARMFLIGRKAEGYYRFRGRPVAQHWTGFSEQPAIGDARRVARALLGSFMQGFDPESGETSGERTDEATDEIHIVYTEFVSRISQRPLARRLAPVVVDESDAEGGMKAEYEFEPELESLLSGLLPVYLTARIYAALLESAASESAARQRAMQSASDNADELVQTYSRLANQVRQAEITQEISEIVGGANALAGAR